MRNVAPYAIIGVLVAAGPVLAPRAIAESPDGTTLAGRQAFTQDTADAAALDGAGPGSKIDLNGCSGW
jgi:hypothetical protein